MTWLHDDGSGSLLDYNPNVAGSNAAALYRFKELAEALAVIGTSDNGSGSLFGADFLPDETP